MPKRSDIKKVLVIGSGPIVIGQAAEFDYAGTQACRALKEEGLEVVLINSNPATIMTAGAGNCEKNHYPGKAGFHFAYFRRTNWTQPGHGIGRRGFFGEAWSQAFRCESGDNQKGRGPAGI